MINSPMAYPKVHLHKNLKERMFNVFIMIQRCRHIESDIYTNVFALALKVKHGGQGQEGGSLTELKVKLICHSDVRSESSTVGATY